MSEASSSTVARRHRRGLTRSAAACQRCRRRKQKCDGNTPACGACAAVGAVCIPSERLVVQQVNEGCECDTLRARLDTLQGRYNDLLREFEQIHPKENSLITIDQSALPATPGNNLMSGQLAMSSASSVDARSSSRFLRPTFSQRPPAKGMNRSALSSAWELWGDDMVPGNVPSQSLDLLELERKTYEDLVNVFFSYRWPYLPVVHRQSFFNKHLSPFLNNNNDNVGPVSTFMVNIVCAIGAAEKPAAQPGHDQIHRRFFEGAVRQLPAIISAEDFECIQCLLLLCMYGHNEPQSVNMWYTIGMALHLAIGINLHRKESLAGLDTLHAEMAKRVFWCAYVMNCSIAVNMGRPLGIQESDITIPLPLQLTDEQLNNPQETQPAETLIPQVTDTSTFLHIIKLRRLNAAIYQTFHSIGHTTQNEQLGNRRDSYFSVLNHWLITAPRYIGTACTFQSMEWFQIAFHHAVLSLYRPSRAVPMPSSSDLRVCTESAIGLISSYSSLYARNKIKYTFVAIHSLFMAAITMLYALRASPPLRQELTKPVVQTNILTFLTLFRGISNGRVVGEKCSNIVERLGNSILTMFDDTFVSDHVVDSEVDTEFQSWFGLQTHTAEPLIGDPVPGEDTQCALPQFPDVRVDIPWSDLFVEGIDIGSTDFWNILS